MIKNYVSYKVKLIKSINGEGRTILPIIKRDFGHLAYSDALKAILKNVNYSDYFKYELFPKTVDEIITYDSIPLSFDDKHIFEKNILSEILCFLEFFSIFQEKLIFFKKWRSKFEYYLLSDSYELAKESLNEIQKKLGISFWIIESKFLLSSNYLEIVSSEVLYQKIKSQCSDYYIKNYIRALRRKTNNRENPKDSIAFLQRREKEFSKKGVEQYKQIYYSYGNNQVSNISKEIVYNLLMMASQLNLVDMFLLIDKVIVDLVSSSNFSLETKRKILYTINNYNLPFACKPSTDILFDTVDWSDTCTKLIYDGKKAVVAHNSLEYHYSIISAIKTYPSVFEAVINYCKLDLLYPQNMVFDSKLLSNLVYTIENSLVKKGNYEVFIKTRNDAVRLILSLSSTTLFYGLSNFYHDVFNGDISQNLKDVITSKYYNRNVLYLFETQLNENVFNSKFGTYESNWYHGWKQEDLIYDNTSLALNRLENFEGDLFSEHISLQKEQTAFSEIIDNRCCERLFIYYTDNDNIQAAIELYVELQFKSKLKVNSFDIDRINKKCNAMRLRDLYYKIDFCIYAHLTNFRGAYGLRFNIQSKNSISAILKRNNILFPSQLKIPSEEEIAERKKYAYFFRHICEADLLTSVLVGYSIKDEDSIVRMRKVLLEREKLLLLALELDEASEHDQIEEQIKKTRRNITTIENFDLEDTLLTNAKILYDRITISDTDIILPFFNNIREMINASMPCDFLDIRSGEYSLFKDSFIKFKKAYLLSLDHQIGINIRHGFFKHAICSLFSTYGLAVEIDCKSDPGILTILEDEFKSDSSKACLIPYIKNILAFTKELYSFVDSVLLTLKVEHSSLSCNDVFSIYIPDNEIAELAIQVIDSANPYDFEEKLRLQMASLINNYLKTFGASLERTISTRCINMIDYYFGNIPSNDIAMMKIIAKSKTNIQELSRNIRGWFKIVDLREAKCSLHKYSQVITKRGWNINLHMSDDLPEEIQFSYLHCIDLIFSNLLMNAEEHSGLSDIDQQIATSLSIENDSMKIYFRNALNPQKDIKSISRTMSDIEKRIKHPPQLFNNHKGNGFYHIADVLNSTALRWTFSFCKEELPKYFAVAFKINWGGNFD